MTGAPTLPPLRPEAPRTTGMAEAVLTEIAARLADCAERGVESSIELTAMPLTTEDRTELESRLGRGEVFATLDSAGRSDVWETRFAGVWFVRNFGEGDRVATESVEVTAVPQILRSHPADMRTAARRLSIELSNDRKQAPSDA